LLDESPCKRQRIFLFVIVIIIGYTSGDLHIGCGINKTFKEVDEEGWGTENGTHRQPSTVSRPKALLSLERRVQTKRDEIIYYNEKAQRKKTE